MANRYDDDRYEENNRYPRYGSQSFRGASRQYGATGWAEATGPGRSQGYPGSAGGRSYDDDMAYAGNNDRYSPARERGRESGRSSDDRQGSGWYGQPSYDRGREGGRESGASYDRGRGYDDDTRYGESGNRSRYTSREDYGATGRTRERQDYRYESGYGRDVNRFSGSRGDEYELARAGWGDERRGSREWNDDEGWERVRSSHDSDRLGASNRPEDYEPRRSGSRSGGDRSWSRQGDNDWYRNRR